MFAAINTGFTQYLAGYTGSNMVRRGKSVEQEAFWTLAEVQNLLDLWIVAQWLNRPHPGLRHPAMPKKDLTPKEAYAALVAVAPPVHVALGRDDYIALLPVAYRSIQPYGINFEGLHYDSAELRPYRGETSGLGQPANGRWEIRYDPYRLQSVYVRDHRHGRWIEAEWTLAKQALAPFSLDVLRAARVAAERRDQTAPAIDVLAEVNRIQTSGAVTARERKAAKRDSVNRPVVPVPDIATESTAALLIGKRHEKAMRKKTGRYSDHSYAPVVYTVVPPGTTPKMMMLAFANFLGLITKSKTTAQDLAEQVVGVMRRLGVSLVICDEVHNLRTNHQAGSEAASSLKMFSERLDATFLYAGIDLLDSDLFSGHMGRQVKGRMMVHEMRPYGHGTQAQRDAWEELVLGIETLLPLGRHPEGLLASLASYLYDRTGGSIGSLRALLGDAAISAILDGAEKLDRKLLDTIPTDHAAEEFRTRTPIQEQEQPRPVRRAE